MQLLFRLFCFLLILNSSGCQIYSRAQEPLTISSEAQDQQQLYNLFERSTRYNDLSKLQQEAECIKLKQDYKTQAYWYTAWLLAYPLNSNFSCVNLDKMLELLNVIQTAPDSNHQLRWLNNNQIDLLTNIDKLQKKSSSLRKQLKTAQKRLKKANSKIKALRAIETSINKKLADEQANQQ